MKFWLIVVCFLLGLIFLPTAARTAESSNTVAKTTNALSLDLGNTVTMEFILIQPGTFMMGSDQGDADEKPVHKVTLTKAFYLAKCPVTEAQWKAIRGKARSPHRDPGCPVVNISWHDCAAFAKQLHDKYPQYNFSLPTEAQWEFACRAGRTDCECMSVKEAQMAEHVWFRANSDSTLHPVGLKKANAFGLHDLLGNTWEWCADWYAPYPSAEQTNPAGPATGEVRVARGGSFGTPAEKIRCSRRRSDHPLSSLSMIGFRLCLAKAD